MENHRIGLAGQVRARQESIQPDARAMDCPGIEEAVRGMHFIEAAVASNTGDHKWYDLDVL